MQLIKISPCGFDHQVVSNNPTQLDSIIDEKLIKNVEIKSKFEMNGTVIIEFSDGDTYSWCDDIFGQMKILDN